jgi:O-antigen/teichoic acid export membrane protein
MIAGIFLLHSLSLLSSARALAVMSVSSFASGAWVLARLRVNPFMHIGPALKKEALRRHWKYGRWAAATGIIMWVPGQLPYIILSAAAGLETSAALKALRNLAMPAAHTYSALFVLLVPAFVRSRERGTLGRALTVSLAAITGCMMLYWAFLALAGPALTRILYKGQYDGYAGFLWLVGTQPLVASVASVLSAALRALEEPQKVFWAYAAMSAGIVTVGWALIAWSGVSGAIIGYTLCNLIGISVMLYLLSKHRV